MEAASRRPVAEARQIWLWYSELEAGRDLTPELESNPWPGTWTAGGVATEDLRVDSRRLGTTSVG